MTIFEFSPSSSHPFYSASFERPSYLRKSWKVFELDINTFSSAHKRIQRANFFIIRNVDEPFSPIFRSNFTHWFDEIVITRLRFTRKIVIQSSSNWFLISAPEGIALMSQPQTISTSSYSIVYRFSDESLVRWNALASYMTAFWSWLERRVTPNNPWSDLIYVNEEVVSINIAL